MSIVKNFLYNVSYQLLTLLLPLITVPYVSKILGASGIGDYAFTYANTQYFVLFGMIGITLYGNREIAYVRDNPKKLKETFFSIYMLQLMTTTISLLLFSLFFIYLNHQEYRVLYAVQGITILAALFDISWLFMGLEQFKKTVVRNTLVKLVSLISIFILVKQPTDIIIYAAILSLSNLIGNLTFWGYIPKIFTLKDINLSLSNLIGNLTFWGYIPKIFTLKDIKVSKISVHLKASLALFIPQIAIQIYVLLDRTLLGVLSNTVEVGYYENSQKIVKIILTLATAIGTVMMPKIANTVASGDLDKVKYYIKNSFFFVSALAFPLMFGLMGIARQLSPWFFTDQFEGIDTLLIISSSIILAISWSNVIGTQLLIPLNKVKEFTVSVTTGAIINLILNLMILKYLGAVGACISTIIAEFAVTGVQLYFVRGFINIKKLISSSLIFLPPSIFMYLLVSYIGGIMEATIVTNLVQVVFGVIGYLVMVEVSYRLIYKMSFIKYIKKIIKE